MVNFKFCFKKNEIAIFFTQLKEEHQMKIFFFVSKFKRFAFDWKNPIGYAIASFIQYLFILYLFLIATSLLCAAIEGILLTHAVLNDLKINLTEINEFGKYRRNHSKATAQLTDFVEIHSLVIQLSEIYSLSNK